MIFGPNGEITGCYDPWSDYHLYLISFDDQCQSPDEGGETQPEERIVWNAQGPQGPVGPRGPQGEPGPPSEDVCTTRASSALTPTIHAVADMKLPAGKYRLSGRVTAENRTPWGQQVYCSVHAGENGASVDEVSGPLPNDDYQFGPNTFIAPFDGIVELDAPGSLWASCHGREVQGENASYPVGHRTTDRHDADQRHRRPAGPDERVYRVPERAGHRARLSVDMAEPEPPRI